MSNLMTVNDFHNAHNVAFESDSIQPNRLWHSKSKMDAFVCFGVFFFFFFFWTDAEGNGNRSDNSFAFRTSLQNSLTFDAITKKTHSAWTQMHHVNSILVLNLCSTPYIDIDHWTLPLACTLWLLLYTILCAALPHKFTRHVFPFPPHSHAALVPATVAIQYTHDVDQMVIHSIHYILPMMIMHVDDDDGEERKKKIKHRTQEISLLSNR